MALVLSLRPATQAHIWQLDFAVAPHVLKEVNYELRVNEQALRWVVIKREEQPSLVAVRRMLQDKQVLDAGAVHFDSAATPLEGLPAGGAPASESPPMQQ